MSYAVKNYKSEGSRSSFYTIKNSKRGFKTFEDYDSAFIAHYNQKELAKYDLAPRVYSDVGRIRLHGKRLSDWGYITEIAQTIGCGGNDCGCCDREELEVDYEDYITELCQNMEDNGFYFGDCHIGNVGFVVRKNALGEKVNVMVCIDTGDESVTSDGGPCFCLECKNGGCCRD